MCSILMACALLLRIMLHSEAGAGANAPEFAVLCQIIHLARSEVPDLPKELKKRAPDSGIDKALLIGSLIDLNASAMEDILSKAAPELKTWFEQGKKEGWDLALEHHRKQLKLIKEAAQRANAEMVKEEGNYETARDEAQVALATALYGTLVNKKKASEVQQLIHDSATLLANHNTARDALFNHGTTEEQSCGDQSNHKAGKTLVNDFFCVCVGTTSKSQDKSCHKDIAVGTAWAQVNTGTNLATGWPDIISKCPPTKQELSREAITTALAAFRTLFGRSVTTRTTKGGEFIFGAHENDPNSYACHTTQGKSCVDYTKTLADGDIPWEAQLLQASTKLGEMQVARKRLERLQGESDRFGFLVELILSETNSDPSRAAPNHSETKRDQAALESPKGSSLVSGEPATAQKELALIPCLSALPSVVALVVN